jgi:hypothetical protein
MVPVPVAASKPAESIEPGPDTTENTRGDTPPDAVNVFVLAAVMVYVDGVMAKAAGTGVGVGVGLLIRFDISGVGPSSALLQPEIRPTVMREITIDVIRKNVQLLTEI